MDHDGSKGLDRDPFERVDLSLFQTFECVPLTADAGGFPSAAGGEPGLCPEIARQADHVLLELKSADGAAGAEELRLLLNEMTREMRAQFAVFRDLRAAAESLASNGDEAQQKLARADLKAATDAMSLIVRTLEKIDSLQRQLARDRAEEAERQADAGGFEEALRDVHQLIEQRAQDLYRKWQREERDGGGKPGGAAGTGPPAADGENGRDSG